ncbi:redoxin domain-containing protein [Candidatus Marinimicrobia bacterium]|jgi:thiol-disulfide isomerase/thioredoxin|nr:redoxin domain-containing protein [Candidatus Neomarinimicrobiota bacterium]
MIKYRNTSNFIFLSIFLILTFNHTYAQVAVGDTISNISLPLCANLDPFGSDIQYFDIDNYNGDPDSSIPRVILLSIFTSWCGYCQTEAPHLQSLHQEHGDDGLLVVSAGGDWGSPYSCEGWADEFNLSYPVMDYMTPWIVNWGNAPLLQYLGVSAIPYTVIIDHRNIVANIIVGFNEELISSAVQNALVAMESDFDGDGIPPEVDNCPSIYNPGQDDLDGDGIGNECDLCDNLNIFVSGNLDGTIETGGLPVIDVLDLLLLSDYIYNNSGIDDCESSAADINNDGNLNLIDIFTLANNISLEL